jgi:hypothetical protein
MHHNKGYGTIATLPIFINGKSEAMVNLKVRSVEGKWEVLREKFCRTLFLLA